MNYCQDGIEVYYGTETQPYPYTPIYGHYELQPFDVNERPYFKKGRHGLWWDGVGNWVIGTDSSKGQSIGYAFYAKDVFCPHQLESEWNWILFDGNNLINAGEDLGINCKYIFVKHNQIRPTTLKFIQMITRLIMKIKCFQLMLGFQ